MQFHIDLDTQDDVAGWLAPTRPDMVPTLLVGAQNPIAMRANVMRSDLAALGTHATGQVGFHVSCKTVPGLAGMEGLELRDAETGLLIYRRKRPGDASVKLFRFTQGFGVQAGLDTALAGQVTLDYENCGEYPFATLFGLFNNRACASVAASGALSYERCYGLAAERGFITMMLLKDPLAALAESLLALQAQLAGTPAAGNDSTQYLQAFVPWFADGMKLSDPAWLAHVFDDPSEAQQRLLANPAVRLLACRDEPAEHRHVAIALEHLATLHLVGVESAFPAFRQGLAEYSGANLLGDYTPQRDEQVRELADRLARLDSVTELLALDWALHDLVRGAVMEAEWKV